MDSSKLAVIVGIAAAAAVLALVLWVRHGKSAKVRGRNYFPSADFQVVLSLAGETGKAAEIARKIQSEATEPWNWSLVTSAKTMEATDKRVLLTALARHSLCNITSFCPSAGDRFDPECMETRTQTARDDVWVVARDVSEDDCGFCVGTDVALRASVSACTVDWWVISKLDCPVGRFVVERVESLIAGGWNNRFLWRASLGLMFPQDLRELPESALDLWRTRLIAELNPHYQGRPDRQLCVIGNPGEPFDTLMETEDGVCPLGDADVDEVVLRDGVPQYGLMCPEGSPLLRAVVRTKAATGIG